MKSRRKKSIAYVKPPDHKEARCSMTSDTSSIMPLVRKLASIHPLTEDEMRAVLDMPVHLREVAAGQDIVRQGDRPSQCCVLLEGFGFRYKVVGDGSRQIMSFHIPGEMPDLMSLHLTTMDHSLGALSRATIGFISHQDVRRLIRHHPHIGDALWRDTLVDAAVLREWMVGMGRLDARSRIAHLFCELLVRMEAVGLAQGKRTHLPMTQGVIADAVGMSTVHVNRIVQELRADGLIALQNGILTVIDWNGLQRVADFDPTYLHLARE